MKSLYNARSSASYFVACLTCLLLGSFAHAAENAWTDESGKPAPDTEFRKTKQDFGGWLVVTPDRDWEKKWQTPPETTPKFTTSDTVTKGQELTMLILFVNPAVDRDGNADVTCDLQSIRPDGSLSINEKGVVCFRGKLQGDPRNIRLALPVIKYVGEAKDLPGKWTIRVTLIDNQRRVRLPLKTSFTLK
jgi:hypothetical protein